MNENNENEKKEIKDCCNPVKNKESKGMMAGIMYGLLPHTGCIAFIIFTILGVTAATSIIKPLLMNRYFFYILIGISILLATMSAMIYLKRLNLMTFEGAKQKWKYLSALYGTTIGVNLLLFMIIFPLAANISSATPTGNSITDNNIIKLQVDIPCPGHAPLITDELKKINGVTDVQFSFPNEFDVRYDSSKTSKQQILSLDVFNEYKATVLTESTTNNFAGNSLTTSSPQLVSGSSGSCVGSGSGCGAGCCGG